MCSAHSVLHSRLFCVCVPGKTEATKLVLQYLAEVGGQEATIAQQILEANPILESLGNARTVRNNNSSRFGKFIEVHFENSSGVSAQIGGARIYSYLLEKSRVVNQSAGERNYHVFFQLCAGASDEERTMLHLPSAGAAAFRILTRGGCLTVDGQNDASDYAELRHAMSVLNFDANEVRTIMKVLAAILHVGNIEFEPDASSNTASVGAEEKYRIANAHESLDHVCELLALDTAVCTRALLTRQLRIAGGEIITVFNGLTACNDNRDTLAKALYEALFLYLISRINVTLGLHSPAEPRTIGVLDIFGFGQKRSHNRSMKTCPIR
jgi:myosin-7